MSQTLIALNMDITLHYFLKVNRAKPRREKNLKKGDLIN